MATGNSNVWGKIGFGEAAVDLSASINRAVRTDATTDNRFRLPADGGHIDGVVLYAESSAVGSRIAVARDGVVPVQISAAVTRGNPLSVGADGRFENAAAGTGRAVAIAMESGSGANSIVSALLLCGGPDAQADIGAMTAPPAGVANDALVDVPAVNGAGATTAQETAINNNFADLAVAINDIRTALRASGLML